MPRRLNIFPALQILAFLAFFLSGEVVGADPVREKLEPFLDVHCLDCHDDETQKGDLNLLDLKFDPGKKSNFKRWERVFDRVDSGEMPPKKKERPEAAAKAAFLKTLGVPLIDADKKDKAAKGRVNVRRLTRREYEHTLHDLLGIDIPLQELLPEDPSTHGFETVATGQQLSHFNLASYLEAADLALDEAFARALKGDKKFSREIPAPKLGKAGHRGGNYRGPETASDNLSIAWPMRLQFYGRMPATRVPESGWYRITLKDVEGINPKNGAVWGTLRSGACASNEPILFPVGIVEATKEKRDLTFDGWIREGHMLELKPNDITLKVAPAGATGGNVSYKGRNLRKQGFEGIGVSGITIERIYPNAKRFEIRKKLLGNLSKEDAQKLLDPKAKPGPLLRRAIKQFANRAFRRPVTDAQIEPYLQLALKEIDRPNELPADGLRAAYRAILCSPRFLTFVEKPGTLDNHALATRMSYMLWNSLPDAELRALADADKLFDYKVRHQQVERMLADPKVERFIASFTDQWLDLKEIDFTAPDTRLYRTFDPTVQASMVAETRGFFRELVRSDASITNVIDSDFAMLNERLARFYGLGKITKPGKGLQKVKLGDIPRGGLITQGAVLKVTANGTTTSPVVRGVYIGERILGMHIPPPPANVAAVEPDIRGAVSIRDQLDKHRNSASCASCHVKIDPPGFALESFDPVGLWRTKYGRKDKRAAKVDPTGVTPEGNRFSAIAQWKAIYVKRPDMLTESFAKQLLTYSTGAEPRFSDRQDLAKIVKLSREKGYGVKWIIHTVVASQAFRTK